MSEWWSVVAVFWALYLADGVSGGRRERLFLSTWRGAWRRPRLRFWRGGKRATRSARPGRSARLTAASWHSTPVWPWAWTLSLADLPAGFSAEGVTNLSAMSTARPPFRPDFFRAVRWEDVGKVETRGGWLWIGERRFVPATEALDGDELRRLAERLGPLSRERREAEISAWWRRRLSAGRARRRLFSALRRTRALAAMNTLQVAGWLAVSVGLLGGWFIPESTAGRPFAPWRELGSPQAAWSLLLAWLVLAHLFGVWAAAGVHRRLHPARKEERASLIFSALLLPPQALRLRAALLRPLALEFAPVAAVLAAGGRETARAAVADTLRDVIYPARPARLPEFFARQRDEAATLARRELERMLVLEVAGGRPELAAAELLAAPTKVAPGVRAWCPRCGDGFLRADGVCPQGVALRKLD